MFNVCPFSEPTEIKSFRGGNAVWITHAGHWIQALSIARSVAYYTVCLDVIPQAQRYGVSGHSKGKAAATLSPTPVG